MSLTVTGKARLVTDPRRGRTGAGKPWANAVLRVVNFKKTDAGWEEHSSFSCTAVAFEDAAFALAEFTKGDEVEFTGRVRELKVWTPERGEPRAQLGLALDEVTAPARRSRATNRGDNATVGPAFSGRPEERASRNEYPDEAWPLPGNPSEAKRPRASTTADTAGLKPPPPPPVTRETAPATGQGGATITNLRQHVEQRRGRTHTSTSTGRPA